MMATVRQTGKWNDRRTIALRGSQRLVPLALALLASLVFCSCAAPYRPIKHHSGYAEHQVGTNEYEVSFLGNGNTTYDRAFDFALLRAAEIALNRQAKSFTVVDVINLSSARKYQAPPRYYWTASPFLSTAGQTVPAAPEFLEPTRYSYLMETPLQEHIFYRPGVKLKIRLLPEPATGYYPYNPATLRERLRTKYGLD